MLNKWRESLITGNDSFDCIHKELFAKVQSLMDAARRGEGGQELGKFLWFLQRYIRKHFSSEEYLQRSLGFADYKLHKEQHEQFVSIVDEMQEQYARRGVSTTLIVAVINTISDWFRNHVNTFDRELSDFLRKVS